jgi:hypothetical protein
MTFLWEKHRIQSGRRQIPPAVSERHSAMPLVVAILIGEEPSGDRELSPDFKIELSTITYSAFKNRRKFLAEMMIPGITN